MERYTCRGNYLYHGIGIDAHRFNDNATLWCRDNNGYRAIKDVSLVYCCRMDIPCHVGTMQEGKMKCQHDYELIDKEVCQSPLEMMREQGLRLTKSGAYIFDKKIIYVFKCKLCKKIWIEERTNEV